MKKLFLICFFYIAASLYSCSTTDQHFTSKSRLKPSTEIIIGKIESRSLEFDPFFIATFKDYLQFEFYKAGKNCSLTNLSIEEIRASGKTDFIYITGMFSQKEYGDAISSKKSNSVIISIFDSETKKTGQIIHISQKELGNEIELKATAETITRLINNGMFNEN